MKKMIGKGLEFASVIIALIVGVIVARSIGVESMLRGKEEPVSLAMTEEGLYEDFIGLPAGDDIPRVENAQDWEDTLSVSCVTIEPVNIIPTGIGARSAWVDAYTNSGRRGGPRRRADVTRMSLDFLGEYSEYFLLQLPDQSYILAQISADDARKLEAGKISVLPVGTKGGVHRQVLANITDLCEQYDVNTEGLFYCINDQWNADHYIMVQLARLGIGFVVVLVLGTILITIVDKVLKVKD